MPFNFYDTHTLLMAVQQLAPCGDFPARLLFPDQRRERHLLH